MIKLISLLEDEKRELKKKAYKSIFCKYIYDEAIEDFTKLLNEQYKLFYEISCGIKRRRRRQLKLR